MRTALSKALRRLLLATRPRRPQGAARLHLPAGSVLRATGPLTLLPTRGTLWVTQPDDPTDHVLSPGQPWRTARPGPILIQSLSPAALTLRAPVGTYVAHVLQPAAPRRTVSRAPSDRSFRPNCGLSLLPLPGQTDPSPCRPPTSPPASATSCA